MNKNEIFELLWNEQDRAYSLMTEYDSMPHNYGETTVYQAEAYVVSEIGKHPNITITEIAQHLDKTKSACSQIIKKLINKELVLQTRNENNRREYNLNLTKAGQKLYLDHSNFNKMCQKDTFDRLSEFTKEELMIHVKVQQKINDSYEIDVDRCKEKYGA